jgi:phage tail protein X
MTSETVISQEGDTVDLIAFTRFGAHGMEQAIFDANPGLATISPILPIGTAVVIPLPEIKERTTLDRLWG